MTLGRKQCLAPLVVVTVISLAVIGVGSAPVNAGASCHSRASEATGTRVEALGNCFGPTLLHASPGESVTWTNRDAIDHNVTGLGFSWGNQLLAGDALSHRFTKAGVYPYSCTFHPGMVGAVVVGDIAPPAELAPAVPAFGQATPTPPNAAARAPVPAADEDRGAATWPRVAMAALVLLVALLASVALRQTQRLRQRTSMAS